MGVIAGSWSFGDARTFGRGAPDLPTIGRDLEAATGLEVEVSHKLRIPRLREQLFDWAFDGATVHVHSFIPAHPYVWENLDRVMQAAGGDRQMDGHLWQPTPGHARLRRPFRGLSATDRAILGLPTILGLRPLDGLLDR